MLYHTLVSLHELIAEVDALSAASYNIYQQTKRLTEQKDTIHSVIEQLSSISEQNAFSTQVTSASMQTLSDTIEDCRNETTILAELSDNLQRQTSHLKL